MALFLSACGEARFDVGGFDDKVEVRFQQSYEAVRKTLSSADQEHLRRILLYSANGNDGSFGHSEAETDRRVAKSLSEQYYYLNHDGSLSWIHHKTASEVFALAGKQRIPDDLPPVEDIIKMIKARIDRVLPAPDLERLHALKTELSAFDEARDSITVSGARVSLSQKTMSADLPDTWPRLSFHISNKGTRTLTAIAFDTFGSGGISPPLPPDSERDILLRFSTISIWVGRGFRPGPEVFEAALKDFVGRDLHLVVVDLASDGKWLRVPEAEATPKLAELKLLVERDTTRKRAYHNLNRTISMLR